MFAEQNDLQLAGLTVTNSKLYRDESLKSVKARERILLRKNPSQILNGSDGDPNAWLEGTTRIWKMVDVSATGCMLRDIPILQSCTSGSSPAGPLWLLGLVGSASLTIAKVLQAIAVVQVANGSATLTALPQKPSACCGCL